MRDFLKYLIVWISQNLSVPFWIVGHIHLSMHMTVLQDVHIILASLGMNLVVAVGFFIDYSDYKKQKDK
jgi:hypothetical protein